MKRKHLTVDHAQAHRRQASAEGRWGDPVMRAKLAKGDEEKAARILGVSLGSARLAPGCARNRPSPESLLAGRRSAAALGAPSPAHGLGSPASRVVRRLSVSAGDALRSAIAGGPTYCRFSAARRPLAPFPSPRLVLKWGSRSLAPLGHRKNDGKRAQAASDCSSSRSQARFHSMPMRGLSRTSFRSRAGRPAKSRLHSSATSLRPLSTGSNSGRRAWKAPWMTVRSAQRRSPSACLAVAIPTPGRSSQPIGNRFPRVSPIIHRGRNKRINRLFERAPYVKCRKMFDEQLDPVAVGLRSGRSPVDLHRACTAPSAGARRAQTHHCSRPLRAPPRRDGFAG